MLGKCLCKGNLKVSWARGVTLWFSLSVYFIQCNFSVMLLLFNVFLIKRQSPPCPFKGISLATKLQQEMHTRCHFHYFCKYHITWNQVCIHLLIFFSNIINYSTFFVYLQYCFALQISSSVEYCPFFLQFFLLFLNSRDFSVGIITHVDVEFSSQGVLQTIKSKIKGIRGREEKILRFCKLDIGLLQLPSLHHILILWSEKQRLISVLMQCLHL